MNAKFNLTMTGNLPDGTQVGDRLQVHAVFTVHGIEAELIDVSSHSQIEYIPGAARVSLYANSVKIVSA